MISKSKMVKEMKRFISRLIQKERERVTEGGRESGGGGRGGRGRESQEESDRGKQ